MWWSLGGASSWTRARCIWGATSSVEEIDSSMVSLQLLDRPHLFPLRPTPFLRCGPPRPCQRGAHNFFTTAPVQDLQVLSDVVKELLHLFQHRCRWVRARRSPVEGVLHVVLHFLQLRPILPWIERHWCSERPSSSVWVAVDYRGREPVPQGERPADWVLSLHCHGTDCHDCQFGTALTGRLSSVPADFAAVLLATSFFGLARSRFCLPGRLSSEPAD